MLKVWISGANGHLGQALCTRLDREKYQLIATDVAEVDVTVPAEVRAFADANRPDVIINCTGFNDEDGCETDPDRAYRVNALAPRNLALAADALGAKMVQFSTDDVFAKASHHPYNEFDAPAPESLYGKSKLAGEEFVRTLCHRYLIVRSAWVYGIGRDFVSTVLNAAEDTTCPRLADHTDRFSSPTSADDLTTAVARLIDRNTLEIFYIASQVLCRRYDFLLPILRVSPYLFTHLNFLTP